MGARSRYCQGFYRTMTAIVLSKSFLTLRHQKMLHGKIHEVPVERERSSILAIAEPTAVQANVGWTKISGAIECLEVVFS